MKILVTDTSLFLFNFITVTNIKSTREHDMGFLEFLASLRFGLKSHLSLYLSLGPWTLVSCFVNLMKQSFPHFLSASPSSALLYKYQWKLKAALGKYHLWGIKWMSRSLSFHGPILFWHLCYIGTCRPGVTFSEFVGNLSSYFDLMKIHLF